MLETIRKTSPQLLLIVVLLALGAGFSFYKAVSSLSGEVSSPDYQRSPSAAISPPAPDQVFEDTDESLRLDRNGFRLPDAAILQVSDGTTRIRDAIVKGSLSAGLLRSLGYREADAGQLAAETLSGYRQILRFQPGQGSSINIQQEVSPDDLSIDSSVDFSFLTENSTQSSSESVSLSWEFNERDRWKLAVIDSGFAR